MTLTRLGRAEAHWLAGDDDCAVDDLRMIRPRITSMEYDEDARLSVWEQRLLGASCLAHGIVEHAEKPARAHGRVGNPLVHGHVRRAWFARAEHGGEEDANGHLHHTGSRQVRPTIQAAGPDLDVSSTASVSAWRTLLGLRGVAQLGQSAAFWARRSPVQIRAPR